MFSVQTSFEGTWAYRRVACCLIIPRLYILVRLMFASANFFFSASGKQPALIHCSSRDKSCRCLCVWAACWWLTCALNRSPTCKAVLPEAWWTRHPIAEWYLVRKQNVINLSYWSKPNHKKHDSCKHVLPTNCTLRAVKRCGGMLS